MICIFNFVGNLLFLCVLVVPDFVCLFVIVFVLAACDYLCFVFNIVGKYEKIFV